MTEPLQQPDPVGQDKDEPALASVTRPWYRRPVPLLVISGIITLPLFGIGFLFFISAAILAYLQNRKKIKQSAAVPLSTTMGQAGCLVFVVVAVVIIFSGAPTKTPIPSEATKLDAAIAQGVAELAKEPLRHLKDLLKEGKFTESAVWVANHPEMMDKMMRHDSVLSVILEQGTPELLLAYEKAGGHLAWSASPFWPNATLVVHQQQDADRVIGMLNILHQRGINIDAPNQLMGGAITAVLANVYLLGPSYGSVRRRIIDYLISMGCDINNPGESHAGSALHQTAYAGDFQMVEFLIQRGANVNAPGKSTVPQSFIDPTCTPMHSARKALAGAITRAIKGKYQSSDRQQNLERTLEVLAEHGGR